MLVCGVNTELINISPPSFPGPHPALSLCSSVKQERVWYLFSCELHQDTKNSRKGLTSQIIDHRGMSLSKQHAANLQLFVGLVLHAYASHISPARTANRHTHVRLAMQSH